MVEKRIASLKLVLLIHHNIEQPGDKLCESRANKSWLKGVSNTENGKVYVNYHKA